MAVIGLRMIAIVKANAIVNGNANVQCQCVKYYWKTVKLSDKLMVPLCSTPL